jgi:hypothetical protein
LTAAIMAKPIPVLPLVGSMRVAPGFRMPLFFGFFDHAFADAVL